MLCYMCYPTINLTILQKTTKNEESNEEEKD